MSPAGNRTSMKEYSDGHHWYRWCFWHMWQMCSALQTSKLIRNTGVESNCDSVRAFLSERHLIFEPPKHAPKTTENGKIRCQTGSPEQGERLISVHHQDTRNSQLAAEIHGLQRWQDLSTIVDVIGRKCEQQEASLHRKLFPDPEIKRIQKENQSVYSQPHGIKADQPKPLDHWSWDFKWHFRDSHN